MAETLESWEYEPVPKSAQHLYRLAWQLESWLRIVVYVELRAARLDWEEPIKNSVPKWPPASLTNDKALHRMATPHQASLSYLSFGQLWSIISDAANWSLFEPYFPPKSNVNVKIEEVKTIRNRVAHFREPHPNDVSRFALFLQDFEPGIRRFCERYCVGKLPTDPADDRVTEELAKTWENNGYGIELRRPDDGWLYAPGRHRNDPLLNARLDLLTHANHECGSLKGVIYRLVFSNLKSRGRFDIVRFVESTKGLHKNIIHILLPSPKDDPALTIPAVHGPEATAELIAKFLRAGLENRDSGSGASLDRARLRWPEYVLWPNHLLTFFDQDMRETVLDLG
jgi:hypothetical protein